DSDGVLVSVRSRPGRPLLLQPGREESVWLHTRIGQTDAALNVEVYSDGGRIARREFVPHFEPVAGQISYGQAASLQMFVEVGPSDLGMRSAVATSEDTEHALTTAVANINRPGELPVEWY